MLRVAVDQAVNLKVLRRLQREGRVELIQAHISLVGGPDRISGDNVYEVEAIFGQEKRADFEHVYSAWLNECQYCITHNVDDFIRRGRASSLRSCFLASRSAPQQS